MKGPCKRRFLQSLARRDPAGLWEPLLRRHSGDEIVAACDAWRISGLVYRRLVESRRTELPAPMVLSFHERYAACAAGNLKRRRALEEIDRAFADDGIEAVVVKGAALVSLIYGDPGARQMSDIDLIVEPARQDDAHARLKRLGYEQDAGHPTVFTRDGSALDVKPEPFGVARIGDRAAAFGNVIDVLRRRTIPFERALSLRAWDPIARAYTLTVHGLKHGFPDGVWLTDLGETIQSLTGAEFSSAVRLFRKSGNQRAIRIGLWRVEDWGYDLPVAAARWRRRAASRVSDRAIRRLAANPAGSPMVEVVYLATRKPGVGHKLHCLREAFFPDEAVYGRGLPARTPGPRSLLRVIEVIARTIRTVLGRPQGA